MNLLDELMADAIAPVVVGVLEDFGCTVSILRASNNDENDNSVRRTYAVDVNAMNVNASLMNPEQAIRRQVFGILDDTTMVVLIPMVAGVRFSVATVDGISIESGPFAGRKFVAQKAGLPFGPYTSVALREAVLPS